MAVMQLHSRLGAGPGSWCGIFKSMYKLCSTPLWLEIWLIQIWSVSVKGHELCGRGHKSWLGCRCCWFHCFSRWVWRVTFYMKWPELYEYVAHWHNTPTTSLSILELYWYVAHQHNTPTTSLSILELYWYVAHWHDTLTTSLSIMYQ
jgi:hypothetical protein